MENFFLDDGTVVTSLLNTEVVFCVYRCLLDMLFWPYYVVVLSLGMRYGVVIGKQDRIVVCCIDVAVFVLDRKPLSFHKLWRAVRCRRRREDKRTPYV